METYSSAFDGTTRAIRITAIAALMLVLALPVSGGQTSDQIASCASYENDIARLQCYDALADAPTNPWHLPDDPLLGFIEIPAGPFTMGQDTGTYDNEKP